MNRTARILPSILTLILLFTLTTAGYAVIQTTTTITVGGEWNDPNTWDTGIVPSSADDVVITQGYTVTIDTNAVCRCLSLTLEQYANVEYRALQSLTRELKVTGAITMGVGSDIKMVGQAASSDTFKLSAGDAIAMEADTTITITANGADSVFEVDVKDILPEADSGAAIDIDYNAAATVIFNAEMITFASSDDSGIK